MKKIICVCLIAIFLLSSCKTNIIPQRRFVYFGKSNNYEMTYEVEVSDEDYDTLINTEISNLKSIGIKIRRTDGLDFIPESGKLQIYVSNSTVSGENDEYSYIITEKTPIFEENYIFSKDKPQSITGLNKNSVSIYLEIGNTTDELELTCIDK